MKVSRREFLKKAGAAGLGGSILGPGAERVAAAEAHRPSTDAMGVLVDLTLCNGCRRCEAACQSAAGFEPLTLESLQDRAVFSTARDLAPDRYTVVNRFGDRGENSDARPIYVKSNCFHCVDPACVSACIVSALRKQPDGPVTYDANKCMGCRYCMVACPFEVPRYEYDNVLAPVVRKCTLCSDEGNPNRGGVPACVQACPKECLTYGKRAELLARAHAKIRQRPGVYVEHVYGEHEAGGTSWLYLSAVPFEEIGFLRVDPAAPPRLTEVIQHGVFKHFMPPVAWCGVLGLAMWMTRPEAPPEQATGEDDGKGAGRQTASWGDNLPVD